MPQLDRENRKLYERLYGEPAPNLYGESVEEEELGRTPQSGEEVDPAIISDYGDEVGAAMEDLKGDSDSQNSRQLIRDMGRASSTIGSAFSGTKPDHSFYDQMDKRASGEMENKKKVVDYLIKKYGYDNAAKRLQLKSRGLNQGADKMGIANERLEISRQREDRLRKKQGIQASEDQRKRTIPGHGVALDVPSARKIREKNASLLSGIGAAQKLQEFVGKRDLYLTDPKQALIAKAQANQYVAELKAALRIELTGGGNISNAEQNLMDTIVVNPMAIFSLDSTNQAALTTLAERFQTRQKTMMGAEGVLPIKPDGVSEQKWNSLSPEQQKKVFDEFRKRNPSSEEPQAEAQEAPPGQWSEMQRGDDGREYVQDVQSGQWYGRDNEESEWVPWAQ